MKYLLWVLIFTQTLVFAESFEIEQRQLLLKGFPCSKCHSGFTNDKVKLPLSRPHSEIQFKHMDSITSCYQCHDKNDRDKLILKDGSRVGFNESYKQCFQCHGQKMRDWELGIHGKQVGSWNGKKYRYSCTNCHEPHHPQFRQMKADPGPVHPRGGDKGGH